MDMRTFLTIQESLLMFLSSGRSESPPATTSHSRWGATAVHRAGLIAVVLATVVVSGATAHAAQPRVGLGTAESFAILAGTTVTNTGPTVISGDLGVSPGSAVTGFPPGQVIAGAQHVADAAALQAQNDLTTGYNDAASRTPATSVGDLGGRTLTPGIYGTTTGMSLTGTVTLDAEGDPDAVFIFQAGSTLITAPSSTVALIGGASPCNVFWQVGSSATLGTSTTFVGSIMALTSATLDTGTTVEGRVLARNGAVNLDTNVVTAPDCDTPTDTPTPPPSDTPTAPPSDTPVPRDHPETGMGGASSSSSAFVLELGGV